MNTVLKQRIITGFVLIVAVILGLLLLPSPIFSVLAMVVFISIGGWEWSKLVAFEDFHRGLFVAWLLLSAYLAYRWSEYRWGIIVAGVIFWAITLIFLAVYEKGTYFYKNNRWLLRISAFFVLIPAWVAIVFMQKHNPMMVLYLVFLVAIADSGAYFSGKAFGKNKLAPELSPGKTREGMFGGLLGVALWSILGAWYFSLPAQDLFYFITLSLAVALLSVAGDLFESLIKREAGQKDSGKILPGHGGILDRVDGLLAALPLFALGIFWGAVQI